MKQSSLVAILCVSLLWECNRQSVLCKQTEETLTRSVSPKVSGIEDAPVIIIAVTLNAAYPSKVATSLVFADRLSVLVQITPTHKLFNILDNDIIGMQSRDVPKQMLCQSTAVSITRLPTFRLGEIGAFQTGPNSGTCIRVLLLHLIKMLHQRT